MGIHFLNWIVKNILVIKLLGFTEIFIFLTSAPVVSVLEDRYEIMFAVIVQKNL